MIEFISSALILLILFNGILIIIDNNITDISRHVRNRLVGNKFGNVMIIVISRPLRDSARIYSAPMLPRSFVST